MYPGPLDILGMFLSRLFDSLPSALFTIIVFVLVGRAFLVWLLFLFQPKPFDAISGWSSCVWGLSEDPELFYRRVHHLLSQRLEESGIVAQLESVAGEIAVVEKRVPLPLAKISMSIRRLFAGRSLFPKRAPYLCVRYRIFTYYLYSSPLPGGLFVSSRLFWRFSNWEYKPLQLLRLWWHARRLTIFDLDALEMFHTCVHRALIDVLDDYCHQAAIPPLDALTRRPILHGFYARLKGTSHLNLDPHPTMHPRNVPDSNNLTANNLTSRSVPERLPFEPPLEHDHLASHRTQGHSNSSSPYRRELSDDGESITHNDPMNHHPSRSESK